MDLMKKKNSNFFNRELSWVRFNERVLSEALEDSVPLLEKLRFLTIVSSNFDEFFMVRAAGLKRQIRQGNYVTCPSGLSPEEQLKLVGNQVKDIISRQYQCLNNSIIPALKKNGIILKKPSLYTIEQRRFITNLFREEIFPVLTPVRGSKGKPLASSGNLRLHIAFLLEAPEKAKQAIKNNDDDDNLAIVQIPPRMERVIFLPSEKNATEFTLLENIVIENAEELFPGYKILESTLFRVTRDADFGVDEERDEDFLEAMEEVLVHRKRSPVVRLSVDSSSGRLTETLAGLLGLENHEVYILDGPIDLSTFSTIVDLQGYDHLRYEKWRPCRHPEIAEDTNLWETLKVRDILLHRPYESFTPVIRLIKEAAEDPDVLAIKMTLYRTSGDSAIVQALEQAADNGKQVTVLVELKARFDEEQNIGWAQRLEKTGVIVVYGIARLKVHAKAMLIIRRESAGIKRYVHLGTGNYNEKTAKLYTDFGFLTSDDNITYETSLFFNAITGYSTVPQLKRLAIAPQTLKRKLLNLFDREKQKSTPEKPGLIIAKMNSLADPDIINGLYEASKTGVDINLNIRGICMLVPGVRGLSENIKVVSIIDRFLEHGRAFYFSNGGNEEVYCSSADWMPRNLERRVELMFPIPSGNIKKKIIDILKIYFEDNVKSHVLQPSGKYIRTKPGENAPFRSQEYFYQTAVLHHKDSEDREPKEFFVRRKPPKNKLNK